MIFQNTSISLAALIFMGFSVPLYCYPSHLDRLDEDEIVEQYSNNIKLKSSQFIYNLNYPIDTQFSREAYDYGKADLAYTQYEKSHVLVNGFDIYKNNSQTFIEYEPFTTKTFHKVGIEAQNPDIKIDWMSHDSQLPSTETIFHHNSNQEGGHSEPQLIADMDALWLTKPNLLLKLFIPRPNKLANSKVIMNGLELYGSFDMCDPCLKKMVAFRKKHQNGQGSISARLEHDLEDKYKVADQNRFVIIYHTRFPYGGNSTYHTEDNGIDYTLGFTRDTIYINGNPKVCTAFNISNGKDHIEELENTVLAQANQVEAKEDMIYGQIHELKDRIARYKQPAYNNRYKFFLEMQMN